MRALPQEIGPLRVAPIGNRARVQIPSAGPFADGQLTRTEAVQLRAWLDRFLDGDAVMASGGGPHQSGPRLVRGLSADGDRPVFEKAGDALSGGTSPAPAQRLHSSSRGEA
ncbi:hypothetical protein [Methylobacterium nodulans]|uniref:Uncharacterized protein n=1 Tax=Methylobacterium nodulans (strain LMG 21967 / CNCM I-2342 / ORS 2060) TaxID=460265 RepID=B8IA56_METNO|nr:hypothetical protein [Methylobacterium nodulans]ACL59119.1 hypothetical protein Mnod_4243 [Methylobacterium nodulans ORS 2060]